MRAVFHRWMLAFVLATVLAAVVGFGAWMLSHSALPPMGGGWKSIVIPTLVTWIAVFVLRLAVVPAQKFSLQKRGEFLLDKRKRQTPPE